MNDVETRLRSLFEEADRPITLEEVRSRRHRRTGFVPMPSRWSGPALAAVTFVVVLVVIGGVALLRPSGDPAPPVAEVPTLHDDLDGSALTGFGLPSHLPAGLELVIAEDGWMSEEMTLLYRGPDSGGDGVELTVSTTRPITGGPADADPPDTETMKRRLREALPDLAVATTTVRGQPALLLTGGVADVHGWETALLVVENPELYSQVRATGVSADDVLAVGRGLQPVGADSFREWAARTIGWDLAVGDVVDDPRSFIDGILGLEAVVDATTLPVGRRVVAPDRLVHQDGSGALPTTTMPADPGASTTATLVEPHPVRLLVTLREGADPVEVASVIVTLGRSPQIMLSPAVEAEVTAAFFDVVLAGAVVIHDDPTVLQPDPGPEPRFEPAADEVPLHPADPDDFPSGAELRSDLQFVDRPLRGIGPGEESLLAGPILHIGVLDDGTRLVLTFDGGADYVERTIRGSSSGAGAGSLGTYGYGQVGGGGTADGAFYMRIRVPLDTSVVLLELDEGTRLWQRPVAGHALIPVEHDVRGPRPGGTIIALDADGEVLGRWETTE